ncbi:hypothetical protein MASR1M65_15050 [Saprospiraceae bacterium]
MPSYAENPDVAALIAALLKSDEKARQINWQELYNINDASYGTVENANGDGTMPQNFKIPYQ